MTRFKKTFEVFAQYAELVREIKLRNPNSDDVDFFLTNFLMPRSRYFSFAGTLLLAADNKDPETQEKTLDRKDDSVETLTNNLRPILLEKLEQSYGEVSDTINPTIFEPEPMVIDDFVNRQVRKAGISLSEWNSYSAEKKKTHPITYEGIAEATKVERQINEYIKKVGPFMLRKTMHRNLGVGLYSIETGPKSPIRKDVNGNFYKLSDNEELQHLISVEDHNGFPGLKNRDFRFLFWSHSTGKHNKMGVIDIDNPLKEGVPLLSKAEMRRAVKKTAKTLERLGHPYIIMFTGDNWQIWFGASEGHPKLGSNSDINAYLRTILIGILAFNEEFAIKNHQALMDERMYKSLGPKSGYTSPEKLQQVRMFFSLHYPADPTSEKQFTGLAAVPVTLADIDKKFQPIEHAHPTFVANNFDAYSALVSRFFDELEIGQDYDELETTPSCKKLPERYPDHELLAPLNEQIEQVPLEDVSNALAKEKYVLAIAKSKGMDAVLHYDSSGNMKFGGERIKATSTVYTTGKKATKTTPAKSVVITSSGDVIHDDFFCREIEKYAVLKKINKLTLVGQITEIDALGNETGVQAVRAIIQEGQIDVKEYRNMVFKINHVSNYGGDSVPMEKVIETVQGLDFGKVSPSLMTEFQEPLVKPIKGLIKDLRKQRKLSTLIVKGAKNYEIVTTKTIQGVIAGIAKESKPYETKSAEIGPVYVALAKKDSKYSLRYFIVGKASIAMKKEDRIKLKQLVYGENDENIIPLNVRTDDFRDQIELCEPKIVVNISYDDTLAQMGLAIPSAYVTDRSHDRYRILGKPLWYSTPLVNARVSAIREDLSPRRIEDIIYTQDPMIRIQKTAPKGLSLVNELPKMNPRTKTIRVNPAFYGVQSSRRIKLDGHQDESSTIPEPMLGPPVGGREREIHLFRGTKEYPGEFQKAYQRHLLGEPGYQVFVDENTESQGERPYYRVTSLGSFFQDAVDDPYGYGADGTNVVTLGGSVLDTTGSKSGMFYPEQVDSYHLAKEGQSEEDQKIVEAMLSRVPGGHDPSTKPEDEETTGPRTSYSQDYKETYKQLKDKLAKVTKKLPLSEGQLKENQVIPNPVLKSQAWEYRIDEYVKEYKRWEEIDGPKEEWERYAQGTFMLWEQPLLEKSRLLREARTKYDLTQEEEAMVDTRFGTPAPNDEPLAPILGDLFTTQEDFVDVIEPEDIE